MNSADLVVVLVVLVVAAVAVAVAAVAAVHRRHESALRRLRHALEAHLPGGHRPPLPREGPAGVRALADVAGTLVDGNGGADTAGEAAERAVRDAALVVDLLSHLPTPVLVCADDGRLALANDAARDLVGAGGLVVGRSVYAVLEREDLAPALRVLDAGDAAWVPVAVRVVGTDRVVPLRASTVPGRATGFVLLGERVGDAPVRPGPRPRFADLSVLDAPPPPPRWADRRLDEVLATVLDCETTGLDPAVDAVVSLGAVHVVRGRVGDDVLDRLVDPGRPVPRTATAVHGLTDADVAGRPPLAEAVVALRRFAAESVVIGHDVGFDLAFLAAAGFAPDGPVLDTLLLAEVAQPGADGYGLDAVAERLGVPVQGRHSATGDALTTAAVLVALLPLLGRAGVHTVGDAVRACTASPSARAMAARPWADDGAPGTA